jgi:hypothetical protein
MLDFGTRSDDIGSKGTRSVSRRKMKIELKTRRSKGIALAFSVAAFGLIVYANIDFIQQQRTHEVFTAIGRANQNRIQKGESWDAYRAYVVELRAINTNYAKTGLKPVFAAYVQGLEDGLALEKAGKNTAEADARIKQAYDKLLSIAKRND